MLRIVLVLGLCVGFALCDTLFFRPFGGKEEQKDDGGPNPLCPDKQGTCPAKSTCCKLVSGKYGCCPLPNAVCCLDHTHCCPEGFSCDVAEGSCRKGNLVIDWLQQISTKKIPGGELKNQPALKKVVGVRPGAVLKQEPTYKKPVENFVPCPGKQVECPSGNTCCQLTDKSYGCCPLPKAVCCNDHKHCCPNGYKCSASTCIKADGQGSVTWLALVMGKNRQDDKVSKSTKTTEKINSTDNQISKKPKIPKPNVIGEKVTKHELPRKDYDQDDDDIEEDFSRHKNKVSNEKGKKTNAVKHPASNVQEIVKPKPVSKKAKENISVKKNDDSGRPKPVVSSPRVDSFSQSHKGGSKPTTLPHKGVLRKTEIKNPPIDQDFSKKPNKVNTKIKVQPVAKSPPLTTPKGGAGATKVLTESNKPLKKVNIKDQVQKSTKQKTILASKSSLPIKKVEQNQQKGKNTQQSKILTKPMPSVKSSSNFGGTQKALPKSSGQESKVKQPIVVKPNVPTGQAKPSSNVPKTVKSSKNIEVNLKNKQPSVKLQGNAAKNQQDIDLDAGPTGLRKLVYKLGMMTQRVKKLLVDSLLDKEVDNLDHPEQSNKDSLKDNKAVKDKKISKIQNVKASKTATKTVTKKPKDAKTLSSPKTVIKPSVNINKDKLESKPSKQVSKTKVPLPKQQAPKVPTQKPKVTVPQPKANKVTPTKTTKKAAEKGKPQPPILQTKAPLPKVKPTAKPPSRVVKPVAKDVPAQKTTQSVGIKKKTTVIDGIPSANLKILKQQLLKKQQDLKKQNEKVKMQQKVNVKPQVAKSKSAPKPQIKPTVNVNIPKTKANVKPK